MAKKIDDVFDDAKKDGLVKEEDYRLYLNIKTSTGIQLMLFLLAMAISLLALIVSLLDFAVSFPAELTFTQFALFAIVFIGFVFLAYQFIPVFKLMNNFGQLMVNDFDDYFKWQRKKHQNKK